MLNSKTNMQTILASESRTTELSCKISVRAVNLKTQSAPALPKKSEEVLVKSQNSAPSYWYSLKENDAPPFQLPSVPPRPHIKTGTIVDDVEVIIMIAEAKSGRLRAHLSQLVVQKQITTNYDLSEINFLVILLEETIDYAAQHDFDAHKLAVLITIYLDTHKYFKWFYWQSPVEVWQYFKEIMVRHTIQDSPDGEEVFQPEECYDIMSHFHSVYLTNLPLIHIHVFGCHRLSLKWPFNKK